MKNPILDDVGHGHVEFTDEQRECLDHCTLCGLSTHCPVCRNETVACSCLEEDEEDDHIQHPDPDEMVKLNDVILTALSDADASWFDGLSSMLQVVVGICLQQGIDKENLMKNVSTTWDVYEIMTKDLLEKRNEMP